MASDTAPHVRIVLCQTVPELLEASRVLTEGIRACAHEVDKEAACASSRPEEVVRASLDKERWYWLARAPDGTPVGARVVMKYDPGVVFGGWLVVLPAWRRKGYARELARSSDAMLASWGYKRLLTYVETTNTESLGLSAALGRVRRGVLPDYWGPNRHAVIMDQRLGVEPRARMMIAERPSSDAGAYVWISRCGAVSRGAFKGGDATKNAQHSMRRHWKDHGCHMGCVGCAKVGPSEGGRCLACEGGEVLEAGNPDVRKRWVRGRFAHPPGRRQGALPRPP